MITIQVISLITTTITVTLVTITVTPVEEVTVTIPEVEAEVAIPEAEVVVAVVATNHSNENSIYKLPRCADLKGLLSDQVETSPRN